MTTPNAERIAANPAFQTLTRTRTRLGLLLTAAVLLVYFSFVFTAVWSPDTVSAPLFGPDSVVTVGIPFGFGVIIFSFLMTGIYIAQANGPLDELNRKVIEESR